MEQKLYYVCRKKGITAMYSVLARIDTDQANWFVGFPDFYSVSSGLMWAVNATLRGIEVGR
jgi:hypothetical protein